MKYAYTAVFTPEESGLYSVNFPDLQGCRTSGDDMADAVYMAHDVLCLTLYDLEQDGKPIPKASTPRDITITGEQFTSVVVVDTDFYERFYKNKTVINELVEILPEKKQSLVFELVKRLGATPASVG